MLVPCLGRIKIHGDFPAVHSLRREFSVSSVNFCALGPESVEGWVRRDLLQAVRKLQGPWAGYGVAGAPPRAPRAGSLWALGSTLRSLRPSTALLCAPLGPLLGVHLSSLLLAQGDFLNFPAWPVAGGRGGAGFKSIIQVQIPSPVLMSHCSLGDPPTPLFGKMGTVTVVLSKCGSISGVPGTGPIGVLGAF